MSRPDPMSITPIKTHKIKPEESIFDILDKYIKKLPEESIIAITSKIISVCENNLIEKNKIDKKELIKQESEKIFPAPLKYPDFHLTLKNHRLIPNAGIDDSNCNNFYVLLPKNPQLTAKKIWEYLRQKHKIKNLGIIITDSNITPLREGVTGITIGWSGFEPIYSYIGKKDIFESKIKITEVNLLDSLATTATLMMGEGNEQTPIAVFKNPPEKIKFQNRSPNKKEEEKTHIDFANDLFSSIIKL